jgi:hypothetical protein
MIRTQIQLTEEQHRFLREKAAEYNVSMAELVRQGVELLAQQEQKPSREELKRRALAFIENIEQNPEQYRDIEGRTDVSNNHDQYFIESVEENLR